MFVEVNFKDNDKKENYKICVGMPIKATQNKDGNICNTMEFTIEKNDYQNCFYKYKRK